MEELKDRIKYNKGISKKELFLLLEYLELNEPDSELIETIDKLIENIKNKNLSQLKN